MKIARHRTTIFAALVLWNSLLGVPNAAEDKTGLNVNAKSTILMEASTGTVLYEQKADDPIEPASFTKVMTLYLVFEALHKNAVHLQDEVWISEVAWRTGGSKMFVAVDTRVPLDDLLKGIAVLSGNDACVAVAEHLYGSVESFVGAMNQKAKELGMSQSRFLNPHGLPVDGQITTARDMATLASAYLKRFPEAVRYHSMQEYSYSNITQPNRNRLLVKDPSVDGLKTGFVAAAGYHLTATAVRDGMRLIAVVMGAKTPGIREREALKLLNWGYRQYALVEPFPLNQPVKTLKVWKGIADTAEIFATEQAAVLVPQGQKGSVRWELQLPESLSAPLLSGQPVGHLVLYVANEVKKTVSLAAKQDIAQAGLLKSLWHTVARVDLTRINWPLVGSVAGGVILVALVLGYLARLLSRRSKVFRS